MRCAGPARPTCRLRGVLAPGPSGGPPSISGWRCIQFAVKLRCPPQADRWQCTVLYQHQCTAKAASACTALTYVHPVGVAEAGQAATARAVAAPLEDLCQLAHLQAPLKAAPQRSCTLQTQRQAARAWGAPHAVQPMQCCTLCAPTSPVSASNKLRGVWYWCQLRSSANRCRAARSCCSEVLCHSAEAAATAGGPVASAAGASSGMGCP